MRLTPSPVKSLALEHGLDVIAPARLRGDLDALAWLQARQPDFLVVVAFGMLLPRSWLETPRLGAINVHASLLPRWRGAAPVERAILAGDRETGVSVMHMVEELDAGCVYARERVPIGARTTAGDLRQTLSELGADLLARSLPAIAEKKLECVPQDEDMATYANKLQTHERNIDWTEPAEIISRLVRAFSPQPGARTRWRGKWVKILMGHIIEGSCSLNPGQLLVHDKSLDVACGHGSVFRVEVLQLEGKKPVKAEAFLRGIQQRSAVGFDPQIKGDDG
jgi:methionyl-tRNA formyltransferase